MTLTAADQRQPFAMRMPQGRLALLLWSALFVVVFAALWVDPAKLMSSLGDTDDATRMIEVRELIAGHRSWFDMTLDRFGGLHPLVSHWSRLIDLPIAAMLSTFELFLPPDQAELATRALWPLLVLFVFVYLLAREAEIRGGRAAALLSVPLAVTCLIGIVQFLPGRIDHHNAIILCSVIGILRLARSFDDEDAGWSAGILLGLAIAIGYEALALVGASLGVAALYGILPGRSLLGPSRAAVTFAATLTIALALTTAQQNLLVAHCDALSINMVALTVTAALGVSIVQAFENRLSLAGKLACLAATGAAGVTLFGLSNPVCLAGPFAEVDPEVFAVWLGLVSETQSMLSMGSKLPVLGTMAFAYLAVGIYCGVKLMRTDGGDGLRFLTIMLLLAIPLSFWQIKLLPYATYLPVPLLAVYLTRPPQGSARKTGKSNLVLFMLGIAAAVGLVGYALLTLSAPSTKRLKETSAPGQTCRSTAAITPLKQLAPGLAVANIDLGPYLVALTSLDALSAPYHRIGPSILEADHIFKASPAEAEQRLHDAGARYVIVCEGLDRKELKGVKQPDALLALLLDGKAPAFLTPVPLAQSTPLKVWSVLP